MTEGEVIDWTPFAELRIGSYGLLKVTGRVKQSIKTSSLDLWLGLLTLPLPGIQYISTQNFYVRLCNFSGPKYKYKREKTSITVLDLFFMRASLYG